MSFQFAAFGSHIEVVNRLPHAFYIFTSRHEFAWSREEWFQLPSGKWRHWVIEKRHDAQLEDAAISPDEVTAGCHNHSERNSPASDSALLSSSP